MSWGNLIFMPPLFLISNFELFALFVEFSLSFHLLVCHVYGGDNRVKDCVDWLAEEVTLSK